MKSERRRKEERVMGEPLAKDAAREMRNELAKLEADQAKATCWGAAVGERGKRIDALRRELARQPDTSAEAVWRYKCGKNKTMILDCEGVWVKHSDCAALAAERDALKAELQDAEDRANAFATYQMRLATERNELEEQLDEALNQLDSARHSVAVLEKRLAKLKGTDDE